MAGPDTMRGVVERAVFVQQVLSAVGHLDDPAVLGIHPLGLFLFPRYPPDSRGSLLGKLLRTAIGDLLPGDVTETNLGALRRYQYLDLRYRRGLRAAHVAQDLGLSDRQARRIHQEAIEALAAVVWMHRHVDSDSEPALGPRERRQIESVPPSELEAEVSRLGATPSLEGTSLVEAFRSALATVGPLAVRHEAEVKVTSLPPLPLIAVDRAVLRQVLVNLLVVSIETGVHQLDVTGRATHDAVEVSFTGHLIRRSSGQPNHQMQHDELLRVVRRLLQLQAGAVEVRDLDRAGSVIKLVLPVVQPATILLVDDNPDTLRLFRRYLSGGSYRPIEASDGRQALELARQVQPRAIVLDVMLPSQDGWEILQALRNDSTTERIPVVICSVLHQEELAQALSATAYLTKPVSRDALLATLRRVMVRPPLSPIPSERSE